MGFFTLLLLLAAAVFSGPASYGLTFIEGLDELGFRPVWVISGWVIYSLLAMGLILVLALRNRGYVARGRYVRILGESLWVCGAVGAPWFMVVNGAWGPLYEDHHGVGHYGITLYVGALASYWWLLSVACLPAAGVVARIVHSRAIASTSEDSI
ncbi:MULTISPECIES: hypothetical protein [unclassified Microbacterium]|uniref:hypothetical protein n=1 Tax=unclassified Microbacterium TaxID=2609290 RepID=UPI00115FF580|nr:MULTISPECIES: hypothetical protein [unclassified Microbacterium]